LCAPRFPRLSLGYPSVPSVPSVFPRLSLGYPSVPSVIPRLSLGYPSVIPRLSLGQNVVFGQKLENSMSECRFWSKIGKFYVGMSFLVKNWRILCRNVVFGQKGCENWRILCRNVVFGQKGCENWRTVCWKVVFDEPQGLEACPGLPRPAQACPGLPRPAQLVKPWRSLKGTLRKP